MRGSCVLQMVSVVYGSTANQPCAIDVFLLLVGSVGVRSYCSPNNLRALVDDSEVVFLLLLLPLQLAVFLSDKGNLVLNAEEGVSNAGELLLWNIVKLLRDSEDTIA